MKAHYKQQLSLGYWVSGQRKLYQRKTINAEPQLSLERIGFIWNVSDHVWYAMLARLVVYKVQHDDCNVPCGYEHDRKVAKWVGTQRVMKKRGEMNEARVKELNDIGFVWKYYEHSWCTQFDRLVDYKAQHGHCNVPKRYKHDRKLAKWVGTQRHRKKNLDEDQEEALDDIGFVWNYLEHSWRTQFKRLVAYKAQHGHCNVPQGYKDDPQLAIWVVTQRNRKRKLDKDQEEALDGIGFIWNIPEHVWLTQFNQLVAYKKQHGNFNVTQENGPHRTLGKWVFNQRLARKKKRKRNPDYEQRLTDIGFI
jgi:hypothetical protein